MRNFEEAIASGTNRESSDIGPIRRSIQDEVFGGSLVLLKACEGRNQSSKTVVPGKKKVSTAKLIPDKTEGVFSQVPVEETLSVGKRGKKSAKPNVETVLKMFTERDVNRHTYKLEARSVEKKFDDDDSSEFHPSLTASERAKALSIISWNLIDVPHSPNSPMYREAESFICNPV
eukprot:IDg7689t1